MKEIPLTQGQYAIVDDSDYDWLNQWKWYADKRRGIFYAVRSSWEKGKHHPVYMHRQILGLERRDKRQSDHQNYNTLDNSRSNIRICSNQQNTMNQKPRSNTTSKYKGVCWHKAAKKWIAGITIKGKSKYLGLYNSETEAALVYNEAAKKYFGNFAFLNNIS